MKIQKKIIAWFILLLLASIVLQSCSGPNDDFTSTNNPASTGVVNVNTQAEAQFKGKIYFTIDYVLYSLDGDHNLVQLTHNLEVHDPAVSPDGKWIAFIVRYKYYSDLVYRSINANEEAINIVASGAGAYEPTQVGGGENNFFWFAQPAWSPDEKNLLFLSDLQKNYDWSYGKLNSPLYDNNFLDLQVFSLPVSARLNGAQAHEQAVVIGYANFGAGGNRDPSYRPKHDNQVIYTHYDYLYDGENVEDLVQFMIVDTDNMTSRNTYSPANGDPALPLTPEDGQKHPIQPAFSPDGNTLAFIQSDVASTDRSLVLMKLPDDSAIADKTMRYLKTDEVLNQGLAGYKSATTLFKGSYLSSPIWSQDGTQMIYYSYNNDAFEIWLVNLQVDVQSGGYSIKGEPVQLTKTVNGHLNAESRPVWIS